MTTEPMAMQEIHEIRLRIYEETKNMTVSEKTAYFRRNSEKAEKKYGLTPANSPENRLAGTK